MTQKHTNTHFSKKVHVSKIQERVFWGKKTAGAHTLAKSLYVELVLILQKENLDLAKGESWFCRRRILILQKENPDLTQGELIQ